MNINTEYFVEPVNRCSCGFTHGVPLVEQQSLGGIQDVFLLYFSSLGEKDLLRHRETLILDCHACGGEMVL